MSAVPRLRRLGRRSVRPVRVDERKHGGNAAKKGGQAMTMITWQEDAGRITLDLPEDLDLPMAPALVDSLRHAFTVGDVIAVRAGAVERLSTASIQALMAASRVAEQGRQVFTIVAPSQGVQAACSDLGLAPWLEKWSQA